MLDIKPHDYIRKTYKEIIDEYTVKYSCENYIVLRIDHDSSGWPTLLLCPYTRYIHYWDSLFDYDEIDKENDIQIVEAEYHLLSVPDESRLYQWRHVAEEYTWNDQKVTFPYKDIECIGGDIWIVKCDPDDMKNYTPENNVIEEKPKKRGRPKKNPD